MSTKDCTMQFRVTEAEAETIKSRADSIGMTASKFMRAMSLSEDKLVILEKGGEIASLMASLHIDLHDTVIHDKVHTLDTVEILSKMERIAFLLSEVLTEIAPLSDYSTNTKGCEY